jgi:hypothetical protein
MVMKSIGTVCSCAYHSDGSNLIVSFNSGRMFVFSGVPADVGAKMGESDDPTRFFNAWIRRNYRWVEIVQGTIVRDSEEFDPFEVNAAR